MSNGWAAVVVAGGRGSRMGSLDQGPKQYRMLGRKTVLRQAVERFIHADRLVVVIHPDDAELCRVALEGLENFPVVVTGGADRQSSVLAGLAALEGAPPAIVLVHDAARPFVSRTMVDAVVAAVRQSGSGIVPGVRIFDTLKRVDRDGRIVGGVERDGLIAVQTPQGFPYARLRRAHLLANVQDVRGLTDDASLYCWAGHDVHFVEASADNFKITTADDLVRAMAMAEDERP